MMKTVPSLVASSTVGIAAAGLALGKPERSLPPRPSSKKRKVADLTDLQALPKGTSPPSRPGTSSSTAVFVAEKSGPSHPRAGASLNSPIIHQQSSIQRLDPSNTSGGRHLLVVKSGEFSPSPVEHFGEGHRRDSVSSRGSWMRRLSTIPNSHNNSPRSSVGPDSPSLHISHSSAAPILSPPGSSPAQIAPNKLVKRATSVRAVSGPPSRTGSRSQIPTLRRPATSHQRSVTLQQQFRDDSMITNDLFQTPTRQIHSTTTSKSNSPESRRPWRHYFDSRPTKLTKERSSGWSSDGGVQTLTAASRRVNPDEAVKPTLVKPAMITMSSKDSTSYFEEDSVEFEHPIDVELDTADEIPYPSTESRDLPEKRARRSLSMHFSSPTSWISRSGSVRGNKQNSDVRVGGKRYSSSPVSTMHGRSTTSHGTVSSRQRPLVDPAVFEREPRTPAEKPASNDPFASTFHSRSRNSSSPLPPLSRLSTFNLDLTRLGLSSSSSSAPRRSPNSPVPPQANATSTPVSSGHASPASATYFMSRNQRGPRASEVADRASTLVGSDNDAKGFTSGDEDDTDFQSETVFDSVRSGATTGSLRSHNTPLDSMFDESPPSLNSHSKSKRLSIHEMLVNGGFQEGNARIVEEDEGMSTPVKGSRSSPTDNFDTPVRTIEFDEDAFPSSPPSFSLATKDLGRLSLDDEDDDEDWTRDEENMDIGNQLSPPSSMNSRKLSPSFRAALADLTHSGSANGNSGPGERPKSNLFDWSEPSSAEKMDYNGNSPRPKTAHVKQSTDGRGGRTVGRRGPSALHIRSQSVPVVPDLAGQRDLSKLTPKFGTWGLGAKGVSEDWDNDFEFETGDYDGANAGENKMELSGMLVPPAIQASQASVVGHVGQIREVCLLVEDLKRLRLLAKEKDLLSGSSAHLWKEAEGIIALAVPDEEDAALSPPGSPTSVILDISDKEDVEEEEDEYYGNDHGPDAEDLSTPDAPFEVLNRHGRPTGFVYDGNTVRRRSVFSPDDDIFGAGSINSPPTRDSWQPSSTSPRISSMKTSSEVARSVMETMHQHRSTSDPMLGELIAQSSNKMPFDTTSLRDLVHRASVLSRTLSDIVRKADGSESPEVSPRRESSPAFTRVFTDPMASPPKHLPRSHSNNSMLSGSIDASPTRSLGQRMHMMTVI